MVAAHWVRFKTLDDRRYSIDDVSKLTETPKHVLRQWEARFPQLKPRRDRANRRYYTAADIDTVRRIKELHKGEGLTTQGVIRRLRIEKDGEHRPESRREVLDLIDSIEQDIRELLDMLDAD